LRTASQAASASRALAQVEPAVAGVERDQLAQAQPRRIQQLEHRPVSY